MHLHALARSGQKEGGRHLAKPAHRVIGVVLGLREKVVEGFEFGRLHCADWVEMNIVLTLLGESSEWPRSSCGESFTCKILSDEGWP